MAIIRTVCKMCPDSRKHSTKNARILFVVKSEFLGYNGQCTHREVLRPGGEESVVEGGEGEVGDELGVGVDERHVRLME